MTNKKLEKAEELKSTIEKYKDYLKYIKLYENQHFQYPIRISLVKDLQGLIGKLNEIDLWNKQLKKDILNAMKIYFIQQLQKAEEEFNKL